MELNQSQNNSPNSVQVAGDVNVQNPIFEQSIIGDIIREILKIRNVVSEDSPLLLETYTIEQKIEKNKIKPFLKELLVEDHCKNYSIIERSLRNISSTVNSLAFDDIFNFYKVVYIEVLETLNYDDESQIISNSSLIFDKIVKSVISKVFSGKISNVKTELQEIYVTSLTNFVFYKCKILVKV